MPPSTRPPTGRSWASSGGRQRARRAARPPPPAAVEVRSPARLPLPSTRRPAQAGCQPPCTPPPTLPVTELLAAAAGLRGGACSVACVTGAPCPPPAGGGEEPRGGLFRRRPRPAGLEAAAKQLGRGEPAVKRRRLNKDDLSKHFATAMNVLRWAAAEVAGLAAPSLGAQQLLACNCPCTYNDGRRSPAGTMLPHPQPTCGVLPRHQPVACPRPPARRPRTTTGV
jgi:hypothetical protein